MLIMGKIILMSVKFVFKICIFCIMIYVVFLFFRLFLDFYNKLMVFNVFCGNLYNFFLMLRIIFWIEKFLDL